MAAFKALLEKGVQGISFVLSGFALLPELVIWVAKKNGYWSKGLNKFYFWMALLTITLNGAFGTIGILVVGIIFMVRACIDIIELAKIPQPRIQKYLQLLIAFSLIAFFSIANVSILIKAILALVAVSAVKYWVIKRTFLAE